MKTIGEILKEREERFQSTAYYVQKGTAVAALCRHLAEKDVGTVCVFDGTRFVGVCGERDVVRRVVARGLDPEKIKVEEVMTTDLLVAEPEEDYQTCLQKMQEAKVRHLPVVSGGKLLGMLSVRNLFEEEHRHCEFARQALTDYVYHVPPPAS